MRLILTAVAALATWPIITEARGVAQMVTLETPLQSTGDSFFEQYGISWGLDLPGSCRVVGVSPNGQLTPDGRIPIRFGNPGTARPAVPGFTPTGGAHLGLAFRGGGVNGSFNLSLAQASQRTSSMVAPSLTVTDGYPGSIFDGQLRPFVTGFIPVVGGNVIVPPPMPPPPMLPQPISISPLQSKIARLQAGETSPSAAVASRPAAYRPPAASRSSSSAERGDISLSQIRAAVTPEDHDVDRALLRQARQAEREGRLYAARQLLRQALKQAAADRREELTAEFARIDAMIKSR